MTHLLVALAWTLIHFCWQAAAIAALFGIASLLLARRTSQARYMVALSALLAMLIAAGATFAWQLGTEIAATRHTDVASSTGGPLHNEFQQAMAITLGHDMSSAGVENAATESIPAMLPWIDGFWLLGVFALSLRSLGGWWFIQRLRSSASNAIPEAARASFNAIVAALDLRRPVELAISRSVAGPITIGFLRATVLLPLSAVTALGPEELKVVLAHELAHVRRADFLWNLVQTFAETVFFFHPAVWWVGSCLRTERELCCDDLALKLCPNPVVYASALFHLEEQRTRQPHLAMALDGNGSRDSLRMRILRILGEPVTHIGRGPSRAFSVSVGAAGLLLLVLPTSQVLASLHPVHAAAVPAIKSQDPMPSPIASPVIATVIAPSPEARPVVQEAPAPAEKPRAGTPASSESKTTYIDRMKAAGYDVDLDKYIAMKIQGVTAEYARDMTQAFGKLSADDLISCKIQGVSPDTIREMKQQGLDVSSVHDAISFRIFGVTPEFIAGMKSAGYSNLSSKELVSLRVQGVTPEYAQSIAKEFPGATVDDLIKTRIFHIDAAFIASAKQHGFTNMKLEKLVQLRISGVLDEDK
jgi:beta-lactamase regulating signal transducer with metallopeptidase domain